MNRPYSQKMNYAFQMNCKNLYRWVSFHPASENKRRHANTRSTKQTSKLMTTGNNRERRKDKGLNKFEGTSALAHKTLMRFKYDKICNYTFHRIIEVRHTHRHNNDETTHNIQF